ncbi:MAG: DUF3306 domain-containing protein [Proteobacteria bacterium]|nr:DUF3306 domain-containing protein [Pseudomonadota bacterium]
MADPKDGFIKRWSLRKRTVRRPRAEEGHADQTAQAPAAAAPEVEPPAGPPSEAAGDPEVVARLPDLDSLDDTSDFSVFLKEGVPDVIRRKALRKLWRVNPVLANLDGLNDYDEDYTVAEALVKGLKTVYEAGKGYLDEDETAAPEGEAAEAEAGEVPAAAEASQAGSLCGENGGVYLTANGWPDNTSSDTGLELDPGGGHDAPNNRVVCRRGRSSSCNGDSAERYSRTRSCQWRDRTRLGALHRPRDS